MRKTLLIVIAAFLFAGYAYGASIVNSKHDMTTYVTDENTDRICAFCHTPHQSSVAASQYPLWNKEMTDTPSFGIYSSPTLDASDISDIGGESEGSQSVSALCMGCHDGTVAVNSLYNLPNDGSPGTEEFVRGTANLETDLSDDHPIDFTYDAALAVSDTALVEPVSDSRVDDTTPYIPLYDGELQCASCHNVHDPQHPAFLRSSNSRSSLCLRCHLK